jgi:hypothetical protein
MKAGELTWGREDHLFLEKVVCRNKGSVGSDLGTNPAQSLHSLL